jgi:hypothetical protein
MCEVTRKSFGLSIGQKQTPHKKFYGEEAEALTRLIRHRKQRLEVGRLRLLVDH